MARTIPSEMDPLIYPAVSISLLVAWIAATVAIVAALCGTKAKKSQPPHPSPSSSPKAQQQNTHNVLITTTTTTTTTTTITATEPPQPPIETTTTEAVEGTDPWAQKSSKEKPISEQQQHRRSATAIFKSNSVVSKGNLIKSLSVRIPGSGAMARYKAKKEETQQQKQVERKPEDSIWTKTIILGERCKVPDEEDAINYDDKGNRIAAYPGRTPRSLPASRQNSFFYPDGIPS